MRSSRPARFPAFVACAIALLGATTNASASGCERRAQRPPTVAGQAQKEKELHSLKQCVARIDDRAACNRFVGKALERLYGNTDFKTGSDEFMLANDIANGLLQPGNARWRLVGAASDQKILGTAQDLANLGRAVVAAKAVAGGPGHVALVLPGTLEAYPQDTPKWVGLRAPNSASAFLDEPAQVFIGCPLSEVWQSPKGVLLYTKP